MYRHISPIPENLLSLQSHNERVGLGADCPGKRLWPMALPGLENQNKEELSMIEYITGEVTELTPATAVVECMGIGYLLNISLNTYSGLAKGKSARLYVYEAIREDAYQLYGFGDRHERELFVSLISVSGVGPNTARMILSSLNPAELEQAIVSENLNLLKSVKGIGAKTAQRVIVDLKDKIKPTDNPLVISTPAASEVYEEAVAALVMLGFSQPQSQKAVQKLLRETPSMRVEEVIKQALKML